MFYNPTTRLVTPEPDSPLSVSLTVADAPFTQENSSFVPGTQFQMAWDSTSLGTFKLCPRKYALTIIEGWIPNQPSINLTYGIFFHRLVETWHKLLASGMPKEPAYLSCVHLALHLGENLPISSDNTRTKETLVRAIVWYLDTFSKDAAKTLTLPSGKAAVELSFQLPFTCIDGVQTYLCGHLDRLCEFQGQFYFSDIKTSAKPLNEAYFNQFSPNNQMSIYSIASQIILERPAAGGIIDAVQLGVNFNRFHRFILQYDPEQTEEDIRALTFWIDQAYRCALTQDWPQNNTVCSMWGGCEFRSICSMAPRRREQYLKGSFHKRTWDPLKSR
jgi:hypothetical protein